MLARTSIRIRDHTGTLRRFVAICSLEENGVDYAILSPEDTDPEAYVAYGYEFEDGKRNYYPFPSEISERLVQEYRDGCDVDLAVMMAGDNLAMA